MSAISNTTSPQVLQLQNRPQTPPSINTASLLTVPPTPKKGFTEVFEVQITADPTASNAASAAAAVFGTWRHEGR